MLSLILEILQPINLLMMNVGLCAGILIGALPGLSGVIAVTVLLPFTFGMGSIPGMYLLLGATCGGMYGGSITAILINTPGAPCNAATAIDGYEMTKKGKAGDALKIALYSSTIGGLVSCVALVFFTPMLAKVALNFGPAEYFALCMFGLCVVMSISGKSICKSAIMAGLGLFLSTFGIDSFDGVSRFMFGRSEMLSGFNTVAVMLGLFALSEILMKAFALDEQITSKIAYEKATIKLLDILKHWKLILSSSTIGVIIGAIPGTGAAIASYVGYNVAKAGSKTPEKYGTGCIEGIAAPEAANNGVSASCLIPLLTLGIPGDVGTAILLGALTMQGVIPGPTLFTEDKFWVWAIMGGLFVINVFMLIQGNLFTRIFANVTKVPPTVIVPSILILVMVGAYSIRNNPFDIAVMLAFGIIGYILKKNDYSPAPLIIGMVLGNLTETNLRRAMVLSRGSISIFFTNPISLGFLLLGVFMLFYPSVKSKWMAKKAQKA